MKTTIVMSLLIGVAFSGEGPKHDISSLGWIAGCWEMNHKGRVVSEQWMQPSGGTMMGMSRSVKEGRTYEYEFTRLVEMGDGSIHYIALPSGQEGASFTLVHVEEGRAVFENLKHDFPQRIIYHRISSDSLVARIEGVRAGTSRAVDYPFRRMKCG